MPNQALPNQLVPSELIAPVADRRPHRVTAHGETRIDDYYWLRERDNPDVLAYLKAENEYSDLVTAPLEPLAARIFDDLVGRIQLTQTSAFVPDGPFEYYSRTSADSQYAWHCRRPRGGGTEAVLIDENAEADGCDFFEIGDSAISPNHEHLAYIVDENGGERFELRIRDVATGTDTDIVPNTYYGLAWANDNRTVFYVRPDDVMRPNQVWRHQLGTPPTDDVLVWEDDDGQFDVVLMRSRSGGAIVLGSDSRTTSERLWIDPDAPTQAPSTILPRTPGITYRVEHQSRPDGDRWLVVTNRGDATNFAVLELPVGAPPSDASALIAHRDEVRVENIDAFAQFFVVIERSGGLVRLVVRSNDGTSTTTIELPDEVHAAGIADNLEYDTPAIRYWYSSLVQPTSIYEYDTTTGESALTWTDEIRGGYSPDDYVATREWAEAADGTRIPISVVRRADVALNATAPLLLYGYGSYEACIDPAFAAKRLPLLDRGVVFAIAHIRGGGEMGRGWWLDGKLEHKMNTFTDFIAAAEHLANAGYCDRARIVARGRSAGGLLMGSICHLRPDLWRGIVAEVAFVDVLTTMSDASIPLTANEWDEWGNPENEHHYRAMRAYSPYDNLAVRAYPDVLATAGLNDPRVQYWEPAKFIAKLRTHATSGTFLLRTDMGAGHAGPSGRFDAWREEASTLAWVLHTFGIDA